MPLCRECRGLVSDQDERCPRCGTPTKEQPAQPAGAPPLNPLQEQVLNLMRQGQKIEAIKLYRTETNLGLKEAKDAVEMLAMQHGVPPGAAGCTKAAAVLLVMLAGGVAALVLSIEI